jgi:FkbM family methyltransferase
MTLELLKSARNAAASAMAWTLYHAPAFEGPYSYAVHAAWGVPGLHSLFRETTERLARQLVRGGRAYRRVPIGSLSPILDVTIFSAKGRYFARVPYEPGATGVVIDTMQPGSVFVDVGANTGYFSVLAALRMGDAGRVLAFEPNPAIRPHLERHLDANGVTSRVTIVDVALADRDHEGRLYLSCWEDNDGLSSLTPAADTLARGGLREDVTIPVLVRRFDTMPQAATLDRIDLVKIDVEGAEAQVLRGMAGTFDRVRPTRIICETPLDSDAVKFLRARGYKASILDQIPGAIPNQLFE